MPQGNLPDKEVLPKNSFGSWIQPTLSIFVWLVFCRQEPMTLL